MRNISRFAFLIAVVSLAPNAPFAQTLHQVKGESYDAAQFMGPNNRPSQNTIAYNLQDAKGIIFRYAGLDPKAVYKVRLTLVTPRLPQTMTGLLSNVRRAEHLIADGEYLAKGIKIPEYTAQRFEYDVPQALTSDGALELILERAEGAMATVISEVWLPRQL